MKRPVAGLEYTLGKVDLGLKCRLAMARATAQLLSQETFEMATDAC